MPTVSACRLAGIHDQSILLTVLYQTLRYPGEQ